MTGPRDSKDPSAAYAARIALLNGVTHLTDKDQFVPLLDAAMAEHALHTLRLVAYIRDHRAGRGSTLLGYFALERLAVTHPRELVHNLELFVSVFGRFDDTAALMNSPAEKGALTLLARQLNADLTLLKESERDAEQPVHHSSERPQISMCAKWVPSEKKHLERDTQLNKKLSRHMKISPATLRKVYLSPLRAKLQLVERFMCSKQWDAIDLNAVPSAAMQRLGKPGHALERHLGDTFTTWRRLHAKGETSRGVSWKMPLHKIVARYLAEPARTEPDAFLEKQWHMAVKDARAVSSLGDTLVVPDVFQSTYDVGKPVSVAVGLLTSSLATMEMFKRRFLTFEETLQLHVVEGSTLFERIQNVLKSPWGWFVDVAAALRVVLRVAIDERLEKHQIPTRLLVVSSRSFGSVDANFESNYGTLESEFADAGFDIPRIVYWCVAYGIEEAPTYAGQAKVALVSGFSTAILRRVLADKVVSPIQTILDIVNDERYAGVVLPPAPTARVVPQRPQGRW